MYRLTLVVVMGSCREVEVVECRAMMAQVLFEQDCSVPAIAHFLGRDRATITHALGQLEKRMTRWKWEALQTLRTRVRRRLAQLPRGAQI